MKLTIADLFEKYKQLEGNEPDLYALVAKSVQICMKAIQLYGIEHIAVSYNGGKEADAALYVFLLAIYASVDDPSSFDTGAGPFVNIIFFRRKEEFPDVIDHVNDVLTLPSLRLLESPTEDFKLGMKHMVETKGVRAVIMGNRLTDPYSSTLDYFTHSSESWPDFMRVFPVLHWSYGDVWRFILAFEVPYCILYERGFTSLGTFKDTVPNVLLLTESGTYKHAKELQDWTKERSNRLSLSKN